MGRVCVTKSDVIDVWAAPPQRTEVKPLVTSISHWGEKVNIGLQLGGSAEQFCSGGPDFVFPHSFQMLLNILLNLNKMGKKAFMFLHVIDDRVPHRVVIFFVAHHLLAEGAKKTIAIPRYKIDPAVYTRQNPFQFNVRLVPGRRTNVGNRR